MPGKSVHRAGHAVVKRSGYTEETLLEWSKKADEGTSFQRCLNYALRVLTTEMMSMSKPMWFRMFVDLSALDFNES